MTQNNLALGHSYKETLGKFQFAVVNDESRKPTLMWKNEDAKGWEVGDNQKASMHAAVRQAVSDYVSSIEMTAISH